MPVADSARDSIFTSEYSITSHITGHKPHAYIYRWPRSFMQNNPQTRQCESRQSHPVRTSVSLAEMSIHHIHTVCTEYSHGE
jgi:hypothetical protein